MTQSFHVYVMNRISGTTGVELLSALHWYLKYWCGAHISWCRTGGVQLSSIPKPGSLPRVQNAGILVKRPVPWSYYQNAVTSSCKAPSHISLSHVLLQLLTSNKLLNLYLLKIHLHGGTGKDGREKQIGWPSMVLIYPWHSLDKKLFGKRSSR